MPGRSAGGLDPSGGDWTQSGCEAARNSAPPQTARRDLRSPRRDSRPTGRPRGGTHGREVGAGRLVPTLFCAWGRKRHTRTLRHNSKQHSAAAAAWGLGPALCGKPAARRDAGGNDTARAGGQVRGPRRACVLVTHARPGSCFQGPGLQLLAAPCCPQALAAPRAFAPRALRRQSDARTGAHGHVQQACSGPK